MPEELALLCGEIWREFSGFRRIVCGGAGEGEGKEGRTHTTINLLLPSSLEFESCLRVQLSSDALDLPLCLVRVPINLLETCSSFLYPTLVQEVVVRIQLQGGVFWNRLAELYRSAASDSL